LRLFVVIVQLEEISVQILVCHVDNANQEEIQTGSDTVPGYKLAQFNREAADFLVRRMAN